MATPKVLTRSQRHLLMGLAVLLLHLALIWALQSGMVGRIKEVIVPVAMFSQFMDLPKPAPVQPRGAPVPMAKTQPSLALQTPPPQTPSMTQAPPIAAAAAAVTPVPTATTAAPASEAVAIEIARKPELTTKPTAPAQVQWPSAQADYLQNPKPPYPVLSRRLSEQGLVVHSVLIGVDGRAISASLIKSSGFDRLDKASYDAIMRWRYTPGLRNGIPEPMSFNVPLNWVLE
jgi:protein TonB